MPRIQAATVTEHRQAQRRALLDAARAILSEQTGAAPTLAEVAARAGLARPSVYQYFGSRDELFEAVLADALPRWSERIAERMAAAGDPGGKVLAYAMANLELVDEGEHAVVQGLSTHVAADALAAQGRAIHDELRTPLIGALTELGAPDPATTAELINAVVHTASRLVENHTPVDTVAASVRELLDPYLRHTASGTHTPGGA
ncbi:HTH-type transcriptional regulator BetI [Nocardia cerradoensis]|uniref:HTH-type transcriptional regulator BetI n=1 Tax=Nocardia cerradoensis TaxID=85688 RepID=A0A231H532_9NOCA|nr:TetR/AcrR family transcriptional regulator [Nocardia cerradoensis]OXR44053.1 HTH-type transcriptional regulator BetI [Nocardia cerradoensis]